MKITSVNREEYLDALKGISILGIIAVHSGLGHQPSPLAEVGVFGANAVQMFFIISTYLACVSIEKLGKLDFRGYMNWICGRITRIAPLYYVALILALIETGGRGNPYWSGNNPITLGNIVGHILFVNGFNPFWINSIISVEWYIADLIILYVMLPLLLKVITSYEKAGIATVISVCGTFIFNHVIDGVINAQNDEIINTWIYNFGFINQFQVMIFGVLLYYIFPYLKKNMTKTTAYLILITGLYLIMGCMFNRNLRGVSIYCFVAMGFTLIIIGASQTNCKLINNVVFTTLGRYCYGIYLFHYIIIDYSYRKGWLINGEKLSVYFGKYVLIVLVSFFVAVIGENAIRFMKDFWISNRIEK